MITSEGLSHVLKATQPEGAGQRWNPPYPTPKPSSVPSVTLDSTPSPVPPLSSPHPHFLASYETLLMQQVGLLFPGRMCGLSNNTLPPA